MGDLFRRIQEVGESALELLGVSPTEQAAAAPRPLDQPVVSFRDVELSFDRPVLRGVSFDLFPGTTKIILGGSGSGKTTILRLILGLLKPDAGAIMVEGAAVAGLEEDELRAVRLQIGMVFQEGALFDSLTVAENVGYRLVEDGDLDEQKVQERVGEMLGFVGLGDFYDKMPSELSGGQRRRVAVARALAARPQIMLYDEPTTGLDPITASAITDLIVKVRDLDGVSSILVTHQLRDAFNVARTFLFRQGGEYTFNVVEDTRALAGTEFLMLRDGRVHFQGSTYELTGSTDPYIREFLGLKEAKVDKSKALTWTELRVGVVVIVSLFVLAFTILYIGGGGRSPFAPRYQIKALMADVNGLKAGAPVRVGGVEVGAVTRVDFDREGGAGLVEVTMRLDRRVRSRVTTESRATLGSLGLLGEKAVDITSSQRGTPVEDGGYLSAAAEDPLKGLLSDASDSTAHLRRILSRMDAGEGLVGKALRDEELYERMLDVSVRLQSVIGKLEAETGPLGRLINDQQMSRHLADSMKGIEAVVARAEAGQGPLGILTKDEEMAREMKALTTRLNGIAAGLEKGEGTAGRLLQDEALVQKIESVATRMDAVLARLEGGEGTAGRLLQDPELYENLNGALKEMRTILRDPRKYLRVKVSLF